MSVDVRETARENAVGPADAQPNASGKPNRYTTIARWVISAILCCVAVGLGMSIFVSLASLKKSPPRREIAERTYNVTTFSVAPASFQEVISAFGTSAADKQVIVSAEVAGLVTQLHPNLEVGVDVRASSATGGGPTASTVEPADLLAKIDESTYQRRIEALERQITQLTVQRDQLILEEENEKRLLDTQKQNLATAQEELESKRRARTAGAGSATQVRNAELQARQYEEQITRLRNSIGLYRSREAAIQAQIDSGKAELENAKLDLKRTSLIPPFDGVISSVFVEEGQYVRPGDAVVELTSLDHIDVSVALTQSQFARLEPLLAAGEQPIARLAENETDAPRWTGRVMRAAPVANELTRTVDVYIEVDNSEQATPLLPGTFVHARINGPILEDAIVVPRDVILSESVYLAGDRDSSSGDAESGEESSQTETAATHLARSTPISVERTVQGFALIRSGLREGDHVVMTNLDVVHDGALLVQQGSVTVDEELAREAVPALRIVAQ